MVPRIRLQLLAMPGESPGSSGFKLTGIAREGRGLCRVWLRRQGTWDRYLDPRFRSAAWDVRAYTKDDSAFSLVQDFTPESLDALGDSYDFWADPSALAPVSVNGDPVHDRVLHWARGVVRSPSEEVVPAAIDSVAASEDLPPASAETPSDVPDLRPRATTPPPTARAASVSDAWDAIADLADRATGAHEEVSSESE